MLFFLFLCVGCHCREPLVVMVVVVKVVMVKAVMVKAVPLAPAAVPALAGAAP